MSESGIFPAKILFVDDEENILKSLRRLLLEENFEILTATSGQHGLDILRSTEGIGLIVSDQRMPGLAGTDFLQQAREIMPDAMRILLTGYADINATIDAINKGGAFRYIRKPWDDIELVQTIRDALNQYNLIKENARLNAVVQKQNEELQEWNSNLKNRVLAQTASIRLRNNDLHELNEKLRKNYESCLLTLSGLIELRDPYAKNHSRNVAELSVTVARKMGLSPEEIEVLRVASLLHDIGKIGSPDSLLLGSTRDMSAEEMEEYRQHAVRGQIALDSIEDLRPAGVLIRHHHENFDGSGFPDQLIGENIPVGARIIALADSIDRFISINHGDNAVEIIISAVREELGKRFDPGMFLYFHQWLGETDLQLSNKTGYGKEVLNLKDLREGMIVAEDVRSGTGLLLLGEGECLDIGKIISLKRFCHLDPTQKGISVFVKK